MSGTDQNQKRHNQQYHVTLSRFNEILVDELRKLGSPLANYVKESGFGSRGYDKSAKAIDRAEIIPEITPPVDFGIEDFDNIFSSTVAILSTPDKISKEGGPD